MASAPVDIPIKVKGLSDLQKLEQKMEQLEREVSKLNAKLPKASNNIKKTGRAAASATGNVQRLGIAFRTTLAPIVAITGSIALMSKALNTVGGRNAELAALKNGLDGLVDSSDAAAEALLKIADKSGKATLFDEEDFTATFKLLTSFRNIGVDAYDRVSMAAADMAQVIGTKPKEAAMQLAKALEDPSRRVTDLARSGTVFTEQQKEQIKALQQSGDLLGAQGIILAEIEKQYGGAAKAAGASGFAGALDGAGESWRDFLEVLGQGSESGAVQFLDGISKGLGFLTRNFDVISAAASAAVGAIVAPFKAMQEGIQSVVQPIGDFEGIFRGTLGVVTKILTDLTQNVLIPVFRIVGQGIGNVIKLLGGLVSGVGTAMEGIVSNITGALRLIGRAMEAFINATPAALLQLFGINAGAAASSALNSFADGIDDMADSVGNYASELKKAYEAAQKVPGLDSSGGTTNPFAGAGPKGAAGIVEDGGSSKEAAKAADNAAKQLKAAEERLIKAEQLVARLQDMNKLEEIQLEKTQAIVNIEREYAELIAKAATGEEAAALNAAKKLELQAAGLEATKAENDLRESALGGIEEEIKALEARVNGTEDVYKLEKQIKDLVESGGGTVSEAQARALVNRKTELQEQVKVAEQLKQSYESLADSISGSLTGAFKDIITGSKSAEQALSDAFASIADAFLDMAMQMIQEWLKMQILGIFTGGLGGGGGGGFGGVSTPSYSPTGAFSSGVGGIFPTFEGGGYTGNASRSGGVDGRGGFPAILHPNETVVDHSSVMGKYSGAGSSSSNGGSKTIRFESTSINSVEYVTVSQAMAMSKQAANDGAKRGAEGGYGKSMRALQNSRSQRSKLGMTR